MKHPKIDPKCQFFIDLSDPKKVMNVNGSNMPLAYWNLIISIRDCGLYAVGMKPHRNWKVTDVKKYFGIKGDAQSLRAQLQVIKEWLNEPQA